MNNSAPITIVHVITSLNMGGAERMLSNLVLGMDPKRFTNIVICLKDLGYWGPILQQHGITVYTLNFKHPWSFITKIFYLRNLILRHKPKYIQGWMYHSNIIASMLGKLAGTNNVLWNIRCSLMDLSQYNFTTSVVFKLGAWIAKSPATIINNSLESIKQHRANGYASDRWLYIPNGFDINKFKPNPEIYSQFRIQYNLAPSTTIIAMIARYDPMKDHATFFKAAGLLAQQHAEVCFLVAGHNISIKNIAIQKMISDNQLQDRVLLLDQVNNIEQILPAVDYVSQTSIYGEGFPNILGEAMACGVECFSTDVGDAIELIGNTGYKIEMQDHLGIAAAWSKILNNALDKVQRSQTARERIVNNYSLDNIVEIYSTCYEANH